MAERVRLLESPKGLSPTGSAHLLVAPLVPLIAGVVAAGARWPELVGSAESSPALRALGWLWLALGVVFWAATLARFLPRWRRGELITSGTFALCRHPLYALLPFFVLPALGLITDNRGYFLVALLSIPLARHAGMREEPELGRLFGAEWARYAARTPRILPLGAAGGGRRLILALWIAAACLVLYASLPRPRGAAHAAWDGVCAPGAAAPGLPLSRAA